MKNTQQQRRKKKKEAPDKGGEDTVAGERTIENSYGDDYFDYFFDEVEVDGDSEDAYA